MSVLEAPPQPRPLVSPSYRAAGRARWVRPAFVTLLLGTAALYLWNLSASGWANEYYAAAVQAGTQSWKALLFGSIDAGNAITVDKPPASLWVTALSGRIFGFSSFSMLLPQALMGVGSVALLYSAVKRWSGPVAGLFAGTVLALTPVAALMFKFNNPDALLVFLLVLAAYCTVRATDSAHSGRGSGRWLYLAGVAIGFGFLTKMLQAFLVLPALGLVFLVAAPISLWQRVGKLLGAFAAMIVAAGWLPVLVWLWPADSRPYIGGSTTNSLLELALGYNGLGRVFGGDGNHGGGGGGMGGGFGGSTGITRLFGTSMGTEISWLLPAALIGLVAGLWYTRRTPRVDRTRAALILWGGWLLVTGVVFSYMEGTMHPYYTVALAPAMGAVVGITVWELWKGKQFASARILLAAILAATGIWGFVLLNRTPDWYPALRWIVVIGSIVVAAIIAVGIHQLGKLTAVVAAAGVLFGLAGTAAYALDTATTAHSGSIPTSGPNTGGGMGGPSREGAGGDSSAVEELLENTGSRWAAATIGAQSAASLELSTGTSIIAIGGFSGGDDAPTLEQFQEYVANGDVHYFISGGGGPGGNRTNEISDWVAAHFTATTIGSSTVYDLTQPITE